MADKKPVNHIRLTSHPDGDTPRVPIRWGDAEPLRRGPVVATLTEPAHRNVIGTHAGAYAVYRALAVAAGQLPQDHRADLKNTSPAAQVGPYPSWNDPERIVSLDPWGAIAPQVFRAYSEQDIDFRPTIAVTKAHINLPEVRDAIVAGRLTPDGDLLAANGDIKVTKAAVDPVWYLPGIARRFGLTESALRRGLFEQTGGMFPELITRPDLHIFLPPIGGLTLYAFGEIASLADRDVPLAVRVHDECNGSDVFGSDICTCRPYLAHGIEECVRSAQKGGSGLIVYLRKEGRALGEVTKFLVYNARKRQEGGDSAATYFQRTECVAGVQDMRFQELMPDVLHWLGITRIHRFVSMSDMKHDAITRSGIEILERVPIPEDLIPADAKVEMEAKKAAGYFTKGPVADAATLAQVKGRGLDV
ncbi:GTP cyclohydrolase II [Pyxidicoccus xibeiensis]|uniref:GTP cyclohydrolase II n=1 Tax=Pyxidicoccus xibeiensis TaxID=2906759 RepID=UPI0020A7F060|nr:GTP cyclohydrolase II [Pyxidicoccus xibeiensis]MCP3136965.1 GTP cyclohydrolase II [Pyxidicoccus xibeiensis]